MRNYHVVLANGTERNVRAADVTFSPNGSVIFTNQEGKEAVVYANGQWSSVELETRDDKG